VAGGVPLHGDWLCCDRREEAARERTRAARSRASPEL